jgi:hypothetical protein
MCVLIYPNSASYAQLYDLSGTICHVHTGLSISVSVAFLRNQLTTNIEGLLYKDCADTTI